eukprot:scaffold26401_cov113-Cylindrotheca_fusiformis.AAC.3
MASPPTTATNTRTKLPKRIHLDSFTDSNDLSSDDEDEVEIPKQIPVTIRLSRSLKCPDLVRVDRCQRLPEYGPKIVFFSGGSAIRDLSTVLKNYTHNSVHLITPFDSGGSSAEIRRALNILSVGDLRNRLMALSDESAFGKPKVNLLFDFRLDTKDPAVAKAEFDAILKGVHPFARAVKIPMRSILLRHMQWFATRMPKDFDLCGASIGNLIITGCFLEHDQDIVTSIYLIGNLLGVKGKVRPMTGANLHIRTIYDDGTEEVGQHLMGKRKVPAKIKKIDLVKSLHSTTRQEASTCHLDFVSSELVLTSDVIVFPMGSFFGSVVVNLLAKGVGQKIQQCHSPKVYVPNTGHDPEMYGYTLLEMIQLILSLIEKDIGHPVPVTEVLNFVVMDTTYCEYCVPIDKEAIAAMGITIIDITLVGDAHFDESNNVTSGGGGKRKSMTLDPTKIAEVLVTLGS